MIERGKAITAGQGLQRQSGVTLIETMVAVLILGIGLLGIMGMQNSALRYNHNAYLFSQANFAIENIAERMRANRPGLNDYVIGIEDPAPASAATACINAPCDSAALADWDLKLWKDFLARALPEGKGGIQRIGTEYQITVQFDDSRGEEDPSQLTRVIQI